jgi:nitrite reductase/ring-hydroxylating ferredoxin subunit
MPAVQKDALALNPNALDLQLVATYPRRVHANLARVWENVLDWEHLPHLHDASFNYCELDEGGRWGWRVWSDADHGGHIELVVDTDRYVARSYAGGKQFSEIWTHLTGAGDYTDIRVEFYSTGVDDDNRADIGEFYLGLYKVLWDEDETMMQERQLRLQQRRAAGTVINLGTIEQLRQGMPYRFELNRREYLLGEQDAGWVAIPTICPHLQGPLAVADQPGQMRCPWHGYVFDLQTGECVTPAHARCSLGLPPEISVQGDQLIASAR